MTQLTDKRKQLRLGVWILSVVLVLQSLLFFILQPTVLRRLAVEDGVIENLSAINWLVGAIVLFVLCFQKRNLWLFLLAVFFTLCLGEEISWGQRMFDFHTPEFIQNNNFQGEFNMHNLNFFERRYGQKNAWEIMYDLGRLFAIFWFLYGCVLPVLFKVSMRLRTYAAKVRFPMMPLSIGIFFLLNYCIFQYFEDLHPSVCEHLNCAERAQYASLPVELRECYDSFVFLVFVLLIAAVNMSKSKSAHTPEPQNNASI